MLPLDLLALVFDLAVQIVYVLNHVVYAIARYLQLSFGLQSHLVDLRLVRLVLVFDVFDLQLGVITYLCDDLFVLFQDFRDLSF